MQAESTLAARQASVVRALVTGDASGTNLDAARVAAMSGILSGKRRKSAIWSCPPIRRALRDDRRLFDDYARARPKGVARDAAADAADFLAWLASQGLLPRELRWLPARLWLRRLTRRFR